MNALSSDVDAGQIPQDADQITIDRHKPGLLHLLQALKLDVTYHRGRGCSLFYLDASNNEVEVLDFVGGYGSLLLGHAHPSLVAAASAYWTQSGANYVQGAVRHQSVRLAEELSRRCDGDYCAVFSNSGAEAVEVALKHALLETDGQVFLSLQGGFHGKTLGALQLTANPLYREPFRVSGLSVRRVRPNDGADLERAFSESGRLAGFIYEPIQGEAGVRPVDDRFLQRAAELCDDHEVPMIADECQTGMGRTGRFLASDTTAVRPNYIVLSKSLGGGIAKIAATMIDRQRYRPQFDLLHTSTFADDEYSSSMALATLKQIDPPLMDRCRAIGTWLSDRLQKLVRQYPGVLREVRGRGLLLGLEIQDQASAKSFLLRYLSSQGLLGPVVCAYLLRAHQMRVAVTLSDPRTLRLQPSVQITEAHCDRLAHAVADVCHHLAHEDVIGLTRFLADEQSVDLILPRPSIGTVQPIHHSPQAVRNERSSASDPRVAWLFHLVDETDVVHMDPALRRLASAVRANYVDRFASIAEPVLMDDILVRSHRGDTVCVTPILLPVTSGWMRRRFEARKLGPLRELVQRGVSVAQAIGCRWAVLGQFTSIVTRNGRSLLADDIHLATGNSYTTSLVTETVVSKLSALQRDAKTETVAIVGAGGNIGSACVSLLAPRFGRTILLGSAKPTSAARLRATASLYGAEVSSDPSDIQQADVVVCATNSVDVLLRPELLKPNAIVCDVSVPIAIPKRAHAHRPDVHWLAGGTVRLPLGERISIPGFPLPVGYTYGCMAEGILLGLERCDGPSLVGPVQIQHVRRMQRLAEKHGFMDAAAHPYSDCVFVAGGE